MDKVTKTKRPLGTNYVVDFVNLVFVCVHTWSGLVRHSRTPGEWSDVGDGPRTVSRFWS